MQKSIHFDAARNIILSSPNTGYLWACPESTGNHTSSGCSLIAGLSTLVAYFDMLAMSGQQAKAPCESCSTTILVWVLSLQLSTALSLRPSQELSTGVLPCPGNMQEAHSCIHTREAERLVSPSACLDRMPSRTCATKNSGPWELLGTSGPSIFPFSALETESWHLDHG